MNHWNDDSACGLCTVQHDITTILAHTEVIFLRSLTLPEHILAHTSLSLNMLEPITVILGVLWI